MYDRRPVYNRRYWLDEDAAHQAANRQTSGLVGIVVVLLLLIVGLFLVHHLRFTTLLEDCLMEGRANCDVIIGTN